MEISEKIGQIALRAKNQSEFLQTEEATKNSLVMPFINALGYDIFNPLEVVPEFTADVGLKKGEKVDYALMRDGKPCILIECKACGSDLNLKHASQLYRYFSVTDARFAILTNGINYHFYTDIDSANKMDSNPFFEFNILDYDSKLLKELEKFHKSIYNLENILSNANELKYKKHIKEIIQEQYSNPSSEFVKFFSSKVYAGKQTQQIIDQFTDLVKSAFNDFVKEKVTNRLKSALENNSIEDVELDENEKEDENDGIETTEEELQGLYIVKAIAAKIVDPIRITYRDNKSYCAILLDNNNRKTVCRLWFNTKTKYIGFVEGIKTETKISIDNINDIYKHSQFILNRVEQLCDPLRVSQDEKSNSNNVAYEEQNNDNAAL